MSSDASEPETIRKNAKACLDLFSQGLQLLNQSDVSDARRGLQDEFARFQLWTSNIGVFAELHSSLDFRLREFSDIKEPFLRQLATIESRLYQFNEDAHQTRLEDSIDEEADESDSSSSNSRTSSIFQDWDKAQLLQSIRQSIDWLHRLSNLVRKASFANQHKRADKFKLEDADKNDLVEMLTNYYAKVIKREFNGLPDTLVQRLAVSMVTRRRRIMYRRSQQQHWKLQQVEYMAKRLKPTPQPGPPTILEPTPEQKVDLHSERATTPVETRTVAQSRLTATTLDANIRRKFSTPSGISKGSTTPLDQKSKVLVPPPPMAAKSGETFICDYCCLILESQIALNNKSWADHVKKDLHPYVCVVDKCNEPTEIYSSSREWLAHMRTRHLMRWHCVAKPHTAPVVLEREEKFIEHMKREHPGKFRDDQLPLIAESSSHPKDPTFDDCPFCPESPANLEDHIGQHLCDLALRSLPWPDDEQSSRQESCLDNESWSSDEGTRDTTNKFRSELPEPDFDDDSEAEDGSKPKEGERLHSYGYLEDIAHQHKPLDLPDLLNDKALTILAQHQHSEYITTMGIQVSVNNSARAHLGFRVSPEDKNIKEELDEDKGEFFGSSTPSDRKSVV